VGKPGNTMEEYINSVLIDMSKRHFTLFSTQGNEKVIECNTYDEFMNVFKVVRDKVDEEMIFYTKPNVAA